MMFFKHKQWPGLSKCCSDWCALHTRGSCSAPDSPSADFLSSDFTGGKLSIVPRSYSLLQPADSAHTDCFTPKYKSLIFFFIPLKLHHRGETATSVDYLSFLCYPMDIHCKADPFSAMHREYNELVYRQKHLRACTLIPAQINSTTFAVNVV